MASTKVKAAVPLRTWLAADLGPCILKIEVTGFVGPAELFSIYQTLGKHFHAQREPGAKPRLVVLCRASRFCDAKITFVGNFDPIHVDKLMSAVQAQKNADAPAIEAAKRASFLRRCRMAAERGQAV